MRAAEKRVNHEGAEDKAGTALLRCRAEKRVNHAGTRVET